MSTDNTTEQAAQPDAPASGGLGTPAPDAPKPIAEFVALPEFPKNALGQLVDIGGFSGVVTTVTNQSIKLRSSEGITQGFNINRLKSLYAPAIRPEPPPPGPPSYEKPSARAKEPEPAPTAPPRNVITNPDFTAPIRSINELASRIQFPSCAFGEHVDIAGFKGVVVDIVKQSLKVRSPEGQTRSYNASVLKNLYGKSA